MQDFMTFSSHSWIFFLFLLIFSGLQCDLLHQLFLPVLWQQRVSHDRPALPVRGDQHRLLERPGCADRGALPLRQEVGGPRRPLGRQTRPDVSLSPRSLLLNDALSDVMWVALLRLVGSEGGMTLGVVVAVCKAVGCLVFHPSFELSPLFCFHLVDHCMVFSDSEKSLLQCL